MRKSILFCTALWLSLMSAGMSADSQTDEERTNDPNTSNLLTTEVPEQLDGASQLLSEAIAQDEKPPFINYSDYFENNTLADQLYSQATWTPPGQLDSLLYNQSEDQKVVNFFSRAGFNPTNNNT